jgi:hypothetical protein
MSGGSVDIGRVMVLGLASASAWVLVARDKLTQPLRHWIVDRLRSPRAAVDNTQSPPVVYQPSRNKLAYWVEYLAGCALCAPVWAAGILYGTSEYGPSVLNRASFFVQAVLAGRMVAWTVLRYLNDTQARDWPAPHEWPPQKRNSGS